MAKEELVMLVSGSHMAMKDALYGVPSDEAFVSTVDAAGMSAAAHATEDVKAKETLANALRVFKGKVPVALGIPARFTTRMDAHSKLNDANGLLIGGIMGFEEGDFWKPDDMYACWHEYIVAHAMSEFELAAKIRSIFGVSAMP